MNEWIFWINKGFVVDINYWVQDIDLRYENHYEYATDCFNINIIESDEEEAEVFYEEDRFEDDEHNSRLEYNDSYWAPYGARSICEPDWI